MSRYRIESALMWLAIVLFMGIVGRMDADDAQLQQDQYCDMVKAGYWPDYQGAFRRECLPPSLAPR